MKMGRFLLLSLIFISEITFAVPATTDDLAPHSSGTGENCKPFKAYFVWDRNENLGNFNVERRYINDVIKSTAYGTNITLNMLDGHSLPFTKTDLINVASKTIKIKPTLEKGHIISYSDLKKDILKHSQGGTEQAFALFFFVNKNTHLDQKETAMEELKKRKVFVVHNGPVQDFWRSLATDKDHVLEIKNLAESDTKAFLDLICRDSSLVCDNDMYWTRTKCLSCADISCQSLCPYFGECTPEKKEKEPVKCACREKEWKNATIILAVIVVLLLIILTVVAFGSRIKAKFCRKDFQDRPDVSEREYTYDEEDSQSGESLLNREDAAGVRHRKRNPVLVESSVSYDPKEDR